MNYDPLFKEFCSLKVIFINNIFVDEGAYVQKKSYYSICQDFIWMKK